VTTTVRGIDVSDHQERQDWHHLIAEDGVRFAFVKASEGNHTRDQRFSTHITDAKAAKITVCGAYHFAWPNEPAATNAQNYIGAVKAHAGPGFVHWLDLEQYPDRRNFKGCTSEQVRAWVDAWCTAVQRAFPGQRVGLYAGNNMAQFVPATSRPRWLPAYPWSAPTWALAEAHARPTTDHGPVEFWQFCGADLDRSLWYGSLADLQKWAAGSSSTTKPKPKPKPPASRPRQVTVRTGMTLSAIALTLGSTVTALTHYNHLSNPNLIYPGQVISAPPTAPTKPKPKPKQPAYTTHVVRKDETLSGIAAAAGIRDWHTLATYNHLSTPNLIRPGQKIRIPKG